MPERAPGRGNLELLQQRQQPVHYDRPLAFTRFAERFDIAVERPPDELEVEAEGEDAAVQRHRTARTRNMLLSSRSTGRSARRSSRGSHLLRTLDKRRGAMRSIQMSGPR